MGPLGIPEILVIVLLYWIIAPIVLSIALRVFIFFAELCRVPEAIGRFVARSAKTFRAQNAPNE
jgi:hypothetical protein